MNKKPPAPSDIADKFMLRFPDGMRDHMRVEAEKNNRSMNAEIIHRLEMSIAIDSFDDALESQRYDKVGITGILHSLDAIREEVAQLREAQPKADE